MIAMNKPQEAMIITKGMTKAFIDVLQSQKLPKSYWSECTSTKRDISSSKMEKMKEMCNEEE